jgi:hypothetical protein
LSGCLIFVVYLQDLYAAIDNTVSNDKNQQQRKHQQDKKALPAAEAGKGGAFFANTKKGQKVFPTKNVRHVAVEESKIAETTNGNDSIKNKRRKHSYCTTS